VMQIVPPHHPPTHTLHKYTYMWIKHVRSEKHTVKKVSMSACSRMPHPAVFRVLLTYTVYNIVHRIFVGNHFASFAQNAFAGLTLLESL